MDKTQRRIAAEMLRFAADTFSNHTCNDYTLPVTPENIEFMKQMIAASDYPDDKIHIYNGQIYTGDSILMGYCAELLEQDDDHS